MIQLIYTITTLAHINNSIMTICKEESDYIFPGKFSVKDVAIFKALGMCYVVLIVK